MSNAASITIHTPTANGAIAQPTADVLDTGTTAVTLPLVAVAPDRVIVEIANTGADTLAVDILAGANPPSSRAALGDLNLAAALAAGATTIVGPFESSRFTQRDGSLSLRFSPASGTIGASIRAYRLPRAA